MSRKKTENKYVTIKLEEGLVNQIDNEVKRREFTSRTDYIKYVSRKDIEVQRELEIKNAN